MEEDKVCKVPCSVLQLLVDSVLGNCYLGVGREEELAIELKHYISAAQYEEGDK